MNALQSYSSDESGDELSSQKVKLKIRDTGTNYDNVGMDISSEDSDADDSPQIKIKKSEALCTKRQERKENTSQSTNIKEKNLDGYSNLLSAHKTEEKTSKEENTRDIKYRSRSKSRERSSIADRRESRHSYDEYRHRRSRSRDRDWRTRERRSRSPRPRGRRSRSRSHGRHSRSRSRDRRHRSRSRSRDRKRPQDLRKEAQQKLAALKATHPELTHEELMRKTFEAQAAEVEKQTGISVPTYYNPSIMNPYKFAEQERKRKLLWGSKTKVEPVQVVQPSPSASGSANMWANTKFSNDTDGKMAQKFKRLMGVKNASDSAALGGRDSINQQESMFNYMEKQYEVARLATHTQRGFGLGFSSQQPLQPPK